MAGDFGKWFCEKRKSIELCWRVGTTLLVTGCYKGLMYRAAPENKEKFFALLAPFFLLLINSSITNSWQKEKLKN